MSKNHADSATWGKYFWLTHPSSSKWGRNLFFKYWKKRLELQLFLFYFLMLRIARNSCQPWRLWQQREQMKPPLLTVSKYGAHCHWLWTRHHSTFDRVQNEAKRVILWTTKDTPIETMRFMQDIPQMQTKAFFSAIENPHNHSMKLWKTQKDADWNGASLGWVKQRIQFCKNSSWQSSSKPRSGKGA